jgi:hypothetical protein
MVMAKPKRELLKFRQGDCGLKIRKDGALEVAGVSEDSPMIDTKGMVNPVMLFAAAWARKDQKCFEALLTNFKDSVKEGFFGQDAKQDYEKALKLQGEVKTPPAPFLNPEVKEPVLTPDSKPSVLSLGNEFETHYDKPDTDVASGATTFEQPKPGVTTWPGQEAATMSPSVASGAVTFEQPAPMTVDEQLDRRDT